MTRSPPKARRSSTRTAAARAPAQPPGDDLTTVAGRLRFARELHPISSRELGIAAGLSTGAVSAIETAPDGGGRAGVATVEALAKVLNVHPSWLAFGLGVPPTRDSIHNRNNNC